MTYEQYEQEIAFLQRMIDRQQKDIHDLRMQQAVQKVREDRAEAMKLCDHPYRCIRRLNGQDTCLRCGNLLG